MSGSLCFFVQRSSDDPGSSEAVVTFPSGFGDQKRPPLVVKGWVALHMIFKYHSHLVGCDRDVAIGRM